jgi:hypothetical protein
MIGICVAAVAVIGVAAAPGCNGNGEALTIEEYFEQLEDLESEADERSNEIEDDFNSAFEDAEDLDDVRDDFQDFIDQQEEVFQDFFDGVQDLNPPEEVEEAHDEIVEAFEGLLDEIDGLRDAIDDADSFEDLDTPDFDQADERLTEACTELQELAADNDIDVDLNCEDA